MSEPALALDPRAGPGRAPASGASVEASLLGPRDPPPCEVFVGGRRWPALIVCDHASAAVPEALGDLGLTRAQLLRHIGWDIGAAGVTRRLATLLGLPAVLGGYSRLVVDCNRRLDDPTSMLPSSDGDVVPGNRAIAPADRRRRALEIFEPYHAAIERELADALRDAEAPALIAVHSFTPRFGGVDRPWHCGVLWDRDPRLAVPLLEGLAADAGLRVGDNEPYSGRHPADYTIDTHAEGRGWPHVCLEIRQDLIADQSGQRHWAERLARLLEPLLADRALYRARVY